MAAKAVFHKTLGLSLLGTTMGLVPIGCQRSNHIDTAAPIPSAATSAAALEAPVASFAPTTSNNPIAYNGPTGVIEGKVMVKGDSPPLLPSSTPPVPASCQDAQAMYRRLFRMSPAGALADALVGVTDYSGYIPAKKAIHTVQVHGCAWESRTITLTVGQQLEVINRDDQQAYLPRLLGVREQGPALMVALPHRGPVQLHVTEPGRYLLTDTMQHPWMKADVFVFNYSTHSITDIEGRYRIEGVPVGTVKVSALHPAINQAVNKQVEVKEGESVQVDFEIPFDASKNAHPAAPTTPKRAAIR